MMGSVMQVRAWPVLGLQLALVIVCGLASWTRCGVRVREPLTSYLERGSSVSPSPGSVLCGCLWGLTTSATHIILSAQDSHSSLLLCYSSQISLSETSLGLKPYCQWKTTSPWVGRVPPKSHIYGKLLLLAGPLPICSQI